jgi:hypothetical protein
MIYSRNLLNAARLGNWESQGRLQGLVQQGDNSSNEKIDSWLSMHGPVAAHVARVNGGASIAKLLITAAYKDKEDSQVTSEER